MARGRARERENYQRTRKTNTVKFVFVVLAPSLHCYGEGVFIEDEVILLKVPLSFSACGSLGS